ncbi:MAG: hypothetical protein AMJ79_03985 [Phycisphaerae bacterium SM23_30]|nr:MAG: hypothetical protein AMJ79_03985 [Phycisphaerae bacterium SM23_30]
MVKNNSNYDERLVQFLNEYLDGQLPPEMVEKVERRLAEDARARRLLAEIKQVSAIIGELPRVPAPEDLAEQIQLQLERDVLLGDRQPPFETAPRTHLRRRRWLAAAAMLMLTGAVVIIIYSILIGPLPPFVTPEPQTPDQEVAIAEPQPQQQATVIEPQTGAETVPQFHLVHLQLPSSDLITDRQKLENLLGTFNIQHIDRTHPDSTRADFAFNSPYDQFKQLVNILMADPNQDINLIFNDDPAQPQTIIAGIDKTQLLYWAGLQNPQKRSMFARELKSDKNFLSNELPAWLTEEFIKNKLPIPVRLLGEIPPTALQGDKEPNEIEKPDIIIEPNDIIDKQTGVITEPIPIMVKVILTLQLEREPLHEGKNIN